MVEVAKRRVLGFEDLEGCLRRLRTQIRDIDSRKGRSFPDPLAAAMLLFAEHREGDPEHALCRECSLADVYIRLHLLDPGSRKALAEVQKAHGLLARAIETMRARELLEAKSLLGEWLGRLDEGSKIRPASRPRMSEKAEAAKTLCDGGYTWPEVSELLTGRKDSARALMRLVSRATKRT